MANQHYFCKLSTIPLRKSAGDAFEMVTELLHGESYEIIEKSEKWLKVRCLHDGYEGWMAAEQHLDTQGVAHPFLCTRPILKNRKDGRISLFSPGCYLTAADQSEVGPMPSAPESMVDSAQLFLGSTYRWGGRGISGIDCSGLTQICARLIDIAIPRDASQQISKGQMISYDEIEGDELIFFQNDKGRINHVGIAIDKESIIHASGFVRIDTLDEKGIVRRSDGLRSHQFHSARRITT